MHSKKGISLVVLMIVIVILIVLATVVFRVLDNNNFNKTIDELEFKKEISQYSELISDNIMNEFENNREIYNQVFESKEDIINYSDPSILQSRYISCMSIRNGKLTLKKNMLTVDEAKWAAEIGIPLN